MIFYASSKLDTVTFAFFNESKVLVSEEKEIRSDELLNLFDKLLKQFGIEISEITGVVLGPVEGASFSASRGMTNFVNVLGFPLEVPVVKTTFEMNEKNRERIIRLVKKSKAGSILLPEYSGEPNITTKS